MLADAAREHKHVAKGCQRQPGPSFAASDSRQVIYERRTDPLACMGWRHAHLLDLRKPVDDCAEQVCDGTVGLLDGDPCSTNGRVGLQLRHGERRLVSYLRHPDVRKRHSGLALKALEHRQLAMAGSPDHGTRCFSTQGGPIARSRIPEPISSLPASDRTEQILGGHAVLRVLGLDDLKAAALDHRLE